MSPDHEGPTRYVGTRFDRQDVRLDGVTFERCTFGPGCRLVFRGETLPQFMECGAERDVSIVFSGPARRALDLLAMLYDNTDEHGRQAVERLFDDVRHGRLDQ